MCAMRASDTDDLKSVVYQRERTLFIYPTQSLRFLMLRIWSVRSHTLTISPSCNKSWTKLIEQRGRIPSLVVREEALQKQRESIDFCVYKCRLVHAYPSRSTSQCAHAAHGAIRTKCRLYGSRIVLLHAPSHSLAFL